LIQENHFLPAAAARALRLGRVFFALYLTVLAIQKGSAQTSNEVETASTKHVLMIFSEARDLPGNVLMEQGVKQELLAGSTVSTPADFPILNIFKFLEIISGTNIRDRNWTWS
jgi:hypothetical protein